MQLLNKIQRELKAPKTRQKSGLPYKYRSAEDIVEAVKPLLGDKGTLLLTDEVVLIGDRYYVKATAILSDGENEKNATALAREVASKVGTDDAKLTGAASSYARKYALNGLLCIDDTKDPDDEEPEASKPLERPASAKPLAPTKSAAQALKEKKAAIADLLNAHPTVLSPLKDKEDYEEACERITGLELNDDNVDLILKSLLN